MINTISNFFKRLFTNSKFPGRTGGYADKKIGEIYDVDTYDSNLDDKKVIEFDPKEGVKRGDNIN